MVEGVQQAPVMVGTFFIWSRMCYGEVYGERC